jgi:hypothetical protein
LFKSSRTWCQWSKKSKNEMLEGSVSERKVAETEDLCVMIVSTMLVAVALSLVEMNTLSFNSRLMTTRMHVKLLDGGDCSMKSMLTECQGRSGIGIGCRSPYGRGRFGLLRAY